MHPGRARRRWRERRRPVGIGSGPRQFLKEHGMIDARSARTSRRALFTHTAGLIGIAGLLGACAQAPSAAPTATVAAPPKPATTQPPAAATAPAATTAPAAAAAKPTTAPAATSAPAAAPVMLKVQVGLQNVEFAGIYEADRQNYLKTENVSQELLPTGPNAAPVTVVAGGGANLGILG